MVTVEVLVFIERRVVPVEDDPVFVCGMLIRECARDDEEQGSMIAAVLEHDIR